MGSIKTVAYENKYYQSVRDLIHKTLRNSNSQYYGCEHIEKLIKRLDGDNLKAKLTQSHYYVAMDELDNIVGCGGITPYWGSETQSVIVLIFVNKDVQCSGIGRTIMNRVLADEYSTRSSEIYVSAAVNAVDFYKKFGFEALPKEKQTSVDGDVLMTLSRSR